MALPKRWVARRISLRALAAGQSSFQRRPFLRIGMMAVLPSEHGQAVIDTCAQAGIPAWEAGRVIKDDGGAALRGAKGVKGGGVRLTGRYTGL